MRLEWNHLLRGALVIGVPALTTIALIAPAGAVTLLPGNSVATGGTTAAASPELDGVVIADTLRNFKFKDGRGRFITGHIQDRVVREDKAGTLDFYTRIVMDATSSAAASVDQFSRSNFAAYTADVDYRIDGLGDLGTTFIDRAGNGSVLAYTLARPLNPGESFAFILTKTNASAYDVHGTTVLSYGGATTASLNTYEPTGAGFASYVETDLGPQTNIPYLNDRGQVSFSLTGNAVSAQTALWTPSAPNALDGALTVLPMLPNSTYSYAGQINSSGQVTGTCYYANGLSNAFLWTPRAANGMTGRIANLGTLPGDTMSFGYGLNDAGEVCGASGAYVQGSPAVGPVIWKAGKPTFEPLPYGAGFAINRSGQVAGYGDFVGSYQGFIWTPSTPNGTSGAYLGINQESSAYDGAGVANDINNAGIAVGYYEPASGGIDGFIWDGSVVIDVGSYNGMIGINDRGQVVGSHNTNTADIALLYSEGYLRDLSSFLPADAPWSLYGAYHINNIGQIVCSSPLQSGEYQTLLLTPVQILTLSPAKHPQISFVLTINGTGFEPNAQLLWNGTSLQILSATSTRIVAEVTNAQASAAGPINLLVLNPDDTAGIKLY